MASCARSPDSRRPGAGTPGAGRRAAGWPATCSSAGRTRGIRAPRPARCRRAGCAATRRACRRACGAASSSVTATPRSASTTAALTPGDATADDHGLGAWGTACGRPGSGATSSAGPHAQWRGARSRVHPPTLRWLSRRPGTARAPSPRSGSTLRPAPGRRQGWAAGGGSTRTTRRRRRRPARRRSARDMRKPGVERDGVGVGAARDARDPGDDRHRQQPGRARHRVVDAGRRCRRTGPAPHRARWR